MSEDSKILLNHFLKNRKLLKIISKDIQSNGSVTYKAKRGRIIGNSNGFLHFEDERGLHFAVSVKNITMIEECDSHD